MNDNQSLEKLLITLQKSFSRVMNKSSENYSERGNRTALIVGDVNFELKVKLTPVEDIYYLNSDGEVELHLSGRINPDLKEEEYE